MTSQADIFELLKLQQQLLDHEGFRSAAYQDSEGFWTIGIGRMIDSKRGGGITSDEAIFLLNNDIVKVQGQLDLKWPLWRRLDPIRRRVMLDMAFNLGIEGLLEFKNTLQTIAAGNYPAAAEGMLASLWASQVGRRAQKLALMMRTGKDLV